MINSAFSESFEEKESKPNLETKIPRQLASANSSFRISKTDLANTKIPRFGNIKINKNALKNTNIEL